MPAHTIQSEYEIQVFAFEANKGGNLPSECVTYKFTST